MKYRVVKAVTKNGRYYKVGDKVDEPHTAGSFAEAMVVNGFFERTDDSVPNRGS